LHTGGEGEGGGGAGGGDMGGVSTGGPSFKYHAPFLVPLLPKYHHHHQQQQQQHRLFTPSAEPPTSCDDIVATEPAAEDAETSKAPDRRGRIKGTFPHFSRHRSRPLERNFTLFELSTSGEGILNKRIELEMLRACLEEIVKVMFDPDSSPGLLKKNGKPNISLVIREHTKNPQGTHFSSTVRRYFKALETDATKRAINRVQLTRDNTKKSEK